MFILVLNCFVRLFSARPTHANFRWTKQRQEK